MKHRETGEQKIGIKRIQLGAIKYLIADKSEVLEKPEIKEELDKINQKEIYKELFDFPTLTPSDELKKRFEKLVRILYEIIQKTKIYPISPLGGHTAEFKHSQLIFRTGAFSRVYEVSFTPDISDVSEDSGDENLQKWQFGASHDL